MKPRVLLADSDAAASGLCRAYLSHFGYQVDTALDVTECVSKLRYRKPDLLLLDRGLRGGGGEMVLAEIRGDACPHVPVVMIADLLPINALSGLRSPPVVRSVQRPIRVAELCDCIGSLLRPRRKSFNATARPKRVENRPLRAELLLHEKSA
ncbi:MAG TPA: response regulator [Planctomycetaceae bacterium]|jgi:DNA-binding response OmpR family regulator|nr:response regulator [Planctomycetaceae bacterium]